MDDGRGPIDSHHSLLNETAQRMRQTRDMISMSNDEISDIKSIIQHSKDTITKTRNLLNDQTDSPLIFGQGCGYASFVKPED